MRRNKPRPFEAGANQEQALSATINKSETDRSETEGSHRRKVIGLGIALGGLAVLGSTAGALGFLGRSTKDRLFVFRSRKDRSVIGEDSIFYPRDEAVRRKLSESGGADRV